MFVVLCNAARESKHSQHSGGDLTTSKLQHVHIDGLSALSLTQLSGERRLGIEIHQCEINGLANQPRPRSICCELVQLDTSWRVKSPNGSSIKQHSFCASISPSQSPYHTSILLLEPAMSEPNPCTGHGIYFSGIFRIDETLTEEQKFKVEFRSFATNIVCSGDEPDDTVDYEIRATGFSNQDFMLHPGHLYFLRGSFFPTNTCDTYNDELFFEGFDRAVIGTAESYSESLANKLGITGIGRVLDVEFYVEDHMQYLKRHASEPDKITLYAVVQHCDYHPETKEATSMTVEYRVPPFKHLAGSPQIVKKGRECQFHGYVKDFNEETNRYIVIVNKVAPTSGHLESAGRKKAVKTCALRFSSRPVNTPFKSPATASASSSSIPFPGSDQTPASIASSGEQPKQPPKKRARAQPKRNATKVIAPESEEI
ncbi:uncharacterized protein MELLADRAFT_84435 [Melampsora larici-populina 98AG31]|uniref:Uncharacterized protein n=1 Tax=Melampsora larici-populina (strain 98AG31 / pathotype 3-4-7) TaxID=747676 RepID=F4RFR2_MELLP|nr:uncharacterized protein MELLADRAFT_84435 [Melampsora larici-populina 98AG31]EGG08854.1 hypothetical protein MELLADRAFT_84435 [Melampsora larici-populina 98AG31]